MTKMEPNIEYRQECAWLGVTPDCLGYKLYNPQNDSFVIMSFWLVIIVTKMIEYIEIESIQDHQIEHMFHQ